MTHYFANVLYLSICMLGNCSCFYFRLLTSSKLSFFKNKPPRTTIKVSNSLDQDQDRHSVGLHLGSTVCKMLLADDKIIHLHVLSFNNSTEFSKYFSVQYIVSYWDIHAYIYHKYSDTLNTFNTLCPLNKATVIFKGSS